MTQPAVTVRPLPFGAEGFHRLARACRGRPHCVFLDSRLADSPLSRRSYLAFDPVAVARVHGRVTRIDWWPGRVEEHRGNAFAILRRLLRPHRVDAAALPPPADDGFPGGLAGYLGYGLRHQVEALPARAVDDQGIAQAVLGLYNFAVVLSHGEDRVFLTHFAPQAPCPHPDAQALEALLLAALDEAPSPAGAAPALVEPSPVTALIGPGPATAPVGPGPVVETSLPRQAYLEAVGRIREYILAGDIYQANLTQRFRVPLAGRCPWGLYERLMALNPAPFSAYLDCGDAQILSSSPERFLAVAGDRVETRPIKGTVRRGASLAEDRELRRWLGQSAKNRAELAMIVDLMRNDLGRVCRTGSVRVGPFPEIETYASVHHLVASVTGQLRPEADVFDLLGATFPGGSITGAPKIRAMEIIDALEPVERGVYTGSIGYVGINGASDWNIAIRTLVVAGDAVTVGAGGGIVMDSDPAEEYEESLLKAGNLLRALGLGEAVPADTVDGAGAPGRDVERKEACHARLA
ncbi:MAG: aminodeoxychorismate synthase component I [Solidesulfovibrio sp. DCME]|uniref:aminodeoxychorismate synthase component I n=1 Tax=Solidesulfovibrio sp. DCME TaxID=3447380 RepID=UPI003D0EB2C2